LRNTAASPSAISGAMNDKAIASASGTRTIPQKNEIAITATRMLRPKCTFIVPRLGRVGRVQT